MNDVRHLEAVVTLAESELAIREWHDRAGVYRALLEHAMPFLKQMLADLAEQSA